MKTFEIAARKKGRKKPVPFKLHEDEKETYYLDPNQSVDSLALVYAEGTSSNGGIDWVSVSLQAMEVVFTPETFERLKKRIRSGELEFDDLAPVYQWATEELTGRPTKSQSD